jgi:hypothetical protein
MFFIIYFKTIATVLRLPTVLKFKPVDKEVLYSMRRLKRITILNKTKRIVRSLFLVD